MSPCLRLLLVLSTSLFAVMSARAEPKERETPARVPAAGIDLHGDPLPQRAISRLGTTRLLHREYVTATAFSADGRRFASWAVDGSLIVWEWPSGKRLHTFYFDAREYPSLQFSLDGCYLSAYGGRRLGVWDLAAGREVVREGASQGPAFSPDGKRVAWLKDPWTICSYDLETGSELVPASRRLHVLALGYDHAGCLVIAEDQGPRPAVSLRDAGTEKVFFEIDLGRDWPGWMQFTPDASCFAFQAKKAGITLFQTRTGKVLYRLAALPGGFFPSALSRDGKTLLLRAQKHGTLQLWDLEGSKPICTIDGRGGEGAVRVGAFSPDGKLLAVGGTNHPHAASFWDIRTGKPVEIFAGSRACVLAIAFSPDGQEVATCGFLRGDPMVRIWVPETGRLLRSFDASPFGVHQVTYTPDGTRLVTCGLWSKEQVCVWDARKLTLLLALKGHLYGAGHVGVSPDGEHVASVGAGTSADDVVVWDLKTGKQLHVHPALGRSTQGLTFLPGSRTLAVCNLDRVRFWEPGISGGAGERVFADGEAISDSGSPDGWVEGRAVPDAFSPDGRAVVVTDRAGLGTPRLVEVATGKEIWRLGDGMKGVRAAFAPDGRTIALGSDDGMIRLFDWPAEKERLAFRASSAGVFRLTFAPDGKRLASVGTGIEAATVLVWDVGDGTNRPLGQTRAEPNQIETWCGELAGADAPAAYRAVWALARAPEQALPRLKALLRAPPSPPREQIVRWIAHLDSDEFEQRDRAEKELLKAGDAVRSPVEVALGKPRSLEQQRRLERILATLRGPEVLPKYLFGIRGVLVLEQIGNPEARGLLQALSKGPPEARLTQEARLSLERLARRRRGEFQALAVPSGPGSSPGLPWRHPLCNAIH